MADPGFGGRWDPYIFSPLNGIFHQIFNKYISEIYICNIEHNRFNLTSYIIAIHAGSIFIFEVKHNIDISFIWAEVPHVPPLDLPLVAHILCFCGPHPITSTSLYGCVPPSVQPVFHLDDLYRTIPCFQWLQSNAAAGDHFAHESLSYVL